MITETSLSHACHNSSENVNKLVWFLAGNNNSQKSKIRLKKILKEIILENIASLVSGLSEIQNLPANEQNNLILDLIFKDENLAMKSFMSTCTQRQPKQTPLWFKVATKVPSLKKWANETTLSLSGFNGKQVYQMLQSQAITLAELDQAMILAALLLAQAEWRVNKRKQSQ